MFSFKQNAVIKLCNPKMCIFIKKKYQSLGTLSNFFNNLTNSFDYMHFVRRNWRITMQWFKRPKRRWFYNKTLYSSRVIVYSLHGFIYTYKSKIIKHTEKFTYAAYSITMLTWISIELNLIFVLIKIIIRRTLRIFLSIILCFPFFLRTRT